MSSQMDQLGEYYSPEAVTPQEETNSSTKKSEMCIVWNNVTQPVNITTGVTIKIVQPMTNNKAQLVTITISPSVDLY